MNIILALTKYYREQKHRRIYAALGWDELIYFIFLEEFLSPTGACSFNTSFLQWLKYSLKDKMKKKYKVKNLNVVCKINIKTSCIWGSISHAFDTALWQLSLIRGYYIISSVPSPSAEIQTWTTTV